MLQRYGSLSGKLHMIELEKDPAAHGLGIRLAGNEEGSRARMCVYVEGIDPGGPAALDGRIQVGDELLETPPAESSYWPDSTPSTSDPWSCPVVAGRETTIEICKGNLGLGLSIVGGCDTLLVNDIDLRQATHDEAIAVLRLTTQRVRLCVFRHQEAYREEDLWDVFSLELTPCPNEGLGFTTVGKR
ncbi:hypothetical protein XENOCAPTIV_023922 [Xenoophorus captivus]|uniref:PDZ domain-containing protein n=1 Tax=Xenoophorus captivus TaxID=1517983 RepID=A0ABV0RUW1_9TELE